MICKHFGYCGGCKFQNLDYFKQLEMKEKNIKEISKKYGIVTEMKPINYYSEWYYRNKMEFTFSKEGGNLICGFHINRRKIFNLEECLIFSKETGKIIKKILEFASKRGYSDYDKFAHSGFLRNLIIRESKFRDERMIGLVTTTQNELDTKGFVEEITSLDLEKKIKSIYWILNDSVSDAVIFEKKILLYGEKYIREKLGEYEFKIYIESFFQANPYGARDFYQKIREYAPITKNSVVLDLFCGGGPIGIFLSKKAYSVLGVEINEEAIENARENARINKIKNLSFVCQDVKKFLGERKDLRGKVDLITINPPRCGLSKKIRKRIVNIESPYLIYSSCNPLTLFPDLKELSQNYKIEFIEPFDFFPHTPHIEVLAFLKRN